MWTPRTHPPNGTLRPKERLALAVVLPLLLLLLWPMAAFAADYTVQAGDTLWRIAKRHNTTVTAIVKANNISNPNLILVGQRLYIPTTGTTAAPKVQPSPTGSWAELPTVKPVPATHFDAIHRWDQMTGYYAQYYRIDPDLIRRIMYIESRGYQYAKNPTSGAAGLMQVMPFWFKDGEDPFDPWTNIGRGTYILRYTYDRYGTWDKAVAAYLGGIKSGVITESGNYYLGLVFSR